MSREWVTVPAEPTPEMVEEICRSHTTEEWPNAFGASAQEIRRDYARAGWAAALAAALAAAPHPPIAQPDVLRAAAEKARAALSDLLLKRDPIVYSDALRALDEALDEAPIAQPQAAGWRPIETAPGGVNLLLGWWDTMPHLPEPRWCIDVDWAYSPNTMPRHSGLSNGFAHGRATHWLPLTVLPEPPKEGT